MSAIVSVLLLGGIAVGVASVGADGVPYTARESGLADHSLPALLYFGFLTLVDTYLGWSLVPFLLGYWAAPSAKWGAVIGLGYAVVALGAYTVGSHVEEVANADELASLPRPPGAPEFAEPDLAASALQMALTPLLPLAAAGAVAVVLIGGSALRFPLLLLLPAAVIVVDLLRRADTPWASIANGLPNAVLVAAGAALLVWTAVAVRRGPGGSGTPLPDGAE